MIRVRAISMTQVLKNIRKADSVKLDCEGAELSPAKQAEMEAHVVTDAQKRNAAKALAYIGHMV